MLNKNQICIIKSKPYCSTKRKLPSLAYFTTTSVGNPWLRHSIHPQEKEGGPKTNEKKKKKTTVPSPTPGPPGGRPPAKLL
jgi:hypothetical protein